MEALEKFVVVELGIIWAEPGIIWWSKPVLVFSLSQAEQHASLELKRIALEKDSTRERTILEEITSQLNVLLILALNPQIKDDLKTRCKTKGNTFRTVAMKTKTNKIEWLKKKTHVTLAKDDDKQNKAHKVKKRKWIKKSKYQRMQKQKKKQRISVIFNYSSKNLTPGMENFLNRGLNFSITPINLNLTKVLVDYARFERTMLWTPLKWTINNQFSSKSKRTSLRNIPLLNP